METHEHPVSGKRVYDRFRQPDGGAVSRRARTIVRGGEGDYVFTKQLASIKHFGLWPLHEAARACFGTEQWPQEIPRPQASIEFEVGSVEEVAAAAAELRARGFDLLHDSKEEPWGQTITRLLTPEGLMVGVCYTPWFHD